MINRTALNLEPGDLGFILFLPWITLNLVSKVKIRITILENDDEISV